MSNINAYDYARTGLDVAKLALGTTFDIKAKQKDIDVTKRGQTLDYMSKTRGQDIVADTTRYTKDVDAQLKREEFANREKIQQMINDNNLILKSMGISGDQILAHINNLAAADRVKLQAEASKAVQLLKNENVLAAIEEQYQRNLKELNLKEDEAMKRAVLGGFFQVISGSGPLSGLVKAGEMGTLVALLKDMYPGIETWNNPNFNNKGDSNEAEKERQWNQLKERMDSYDKAIQRRKGDGEIQIKHKTKLGF